MKNFLSTRGLGYFLTIPAVLCGIAGEILYQNFGTNSFNITLDESLIITLWIAIVVGISSFFADVKALRYISYLLFLYDFIIYIRTQAKYITNVVVGIDGNTFTASFIANIVCLLLAFVLMLIAALTSNKGKKNVNNNVDEEEQKEAVKS